MKTSNRVMTWLRSLVQEGHEEAELLSMSLPELRDLYEDECVPAVEITIVTVTAAGGLSRKKVA